MRNRKAPILPTKVVEEVVVSSPKRRARSKKKKSKGASSANWNALRFGWKASLLDPFSVHGFRIPDENTYASGVATFRRRLTIGPVQDGTTGNFACGVAFVPTVAASVIGASAYDNSNIDPRVFFGTYSAIGTFPSGLANRYRTVSAGLAVYSTTAFGKNQGRQICAYVPGTDKQTGAIVPSGSYTQSVMLSLPNVTDKPVNMESPCTISWVPTDPTNYDYHLTTSSTSGTILSNDYYNPGTLMFIATGVDPSASFDVYIVLNVEYLPSSSATSFVDILPSNYDPLAMAEALNSAGESSRRIFNSVPPDSVYSTVAGENNFSLGAWASMTSLMSMGQSQVGKLGSAIMDGLSRSLTHGGYALGQMGLNYGLNRAISTFRGTARPIGY